MEAYAYENFEDNNAFFWINPLKSIFNNWHPSSSKSDEKGCGVASLAKYGKWYHVSCDRKALVVCEVGKDGLWFLRVYLF